MNRPGGVVVGQGGYAGQGQGGVVVGQGGYVYQYDIFGRKISPNEPRQYVTTSVANAIRASVNFQKMYSGATLEDFRKVDPINSAIVDEWLTTHNANAGYAIEDDSLAGLIIP